jgi:hypothetical protein
MPSITRLFAIALLCMLGACASKTSSRATEAAASPLFDLNIVRANIPDVLAEAQKAPYLVPEDQTCGALSFQVHRLNAVLGADLDTPASANAPSLLERGTSAAEDSAMGAIQRSAEGLVPFRSWVRKLSGAERYSRRVSAAITAGSIRRAFLKGIAASHGCAWHAPEMVAPADAAASAVDAAASVPVPGPAASEPETVE